MIFSALESLNKALFNGHVQFTEIISFNREIGRWWRLTGAFTKTAHTRLASRGTARGGGDYRFVRDIEWGYCVRAGILNRAIDTLPQSLYRKHSSSYTFLFPAACVYLNLCVIYIAMVDYNYRCYDNLCAYHVTPVLLCIITVTWLVRATQPHVPPG